MRLRLEEKGLYRMEPRCCSRTWRVGGGEGQGSVRGLDGMDMCLCGMAVSVKGR